MTNYILSCGTFQMAGREFCKPTLFLRHVAGSFDISVDSPGRSSQRMEEILPFRFPHLNFVGWIPVLFGHLVHHRYRLHSNCTGFRNGDHFPGSRRIRT